MINEGRVQNMDPWSMDHPYGPGPRIPSGSMDYPRGPHLILTRGLNKFQEP